MGKRGPKPGEAYTKLTPATHQTIVAALRSGQALYVACGMSGANADAAVRWLRDGARLIERDERMREKLGASYQPEHDAFQRRMIKLSRDATEAVAQAEAEMILRIRTAAQKPPTRRVIKRRTTTAADGSVTVTTEELEEEGSPDWKAEAWVAERRFARRWGRSLQIDMELNAPDELGGVEEASEMAALDAESAIALARAKVDELAVVRARKAERMGLPAGQIIDVEVVETPEAQA